MAKQKKPTYNFNDFFGYSNQYHLMGAQTGESFFTFLAKLGHYLQADVRVVGQTDYHSDKYDCHYLMAFTQLENPFITLIILENKSTLFNQKGYPTAKKERNLSFHTLSLFDEFCYILNSQGICIHQWEHTDCDYLLMYYANKEDNIDSFHEKLLHIPKTRVKATPNLFVEEVPDKKKSPKRKYFEDLFCDAQLKINQWEQDNIKRVMGNIKIPDQNLSEQYKYLYEDLTPPVVVFNSKYLEFVKKDPSYDKIELF